MILKLDVSKLPGIQSAIHFFGSTRLLLP